ncbi:MAG: amino acid adenylation domain-containing protein [Candidatus Faecousia sp.]|nr:amino acid adenylation domain-containing protein [Candidatus Faecousia sp.]
MNHVLDYLKRLERLCPDKTAVEDRRTAYTFRQMGELARMLAGHPALENKRSCAVGVMADRSASTAVYFLAALFSGNFYVPVDPQLPEKKLQTIVADAGIDLFYTDEENKQRLRDVGFTGICLSLTDKPCWQSADRSGELTPRSPAYMVYTSGSTGVPKGVLKSHGAIVSFIEAYTETFPFDADDVIGNQTPFFFDASAKDFYLMLKTGAAMEVLPKELFAMPPMLIDYLNKKKVTFISWVPTALSIVAQLNTFTEILPTTLKRVFFVGEVMPVKYLNKWMDALPGLEYVNLYGSSEIAGVCCYYPVKQKLDAARSLPMGKPLRNCRLYLMDGERVITQPHMPGEIYLVSPALAEGYYHDPEKTAASFIQKDFGDGVVRRAFRSGDIAQYDEAGNLVFSARRDAQIKHLGNRIELGEIEAVANSLEQLQRCCCLYDQKKQKIVLFAQSAPAASPADAKAIRSLLRPRLSSYMLPNKVVLLEQWPLNANGKTDRQALKALL